jgi:hypothetical protein
MGYKAGCGRDRRRSSDGRENSKGGFSVKELQEKMSKDGA